MTAPNGAAPPAPEPQPDPSVEGLQVPTIEIHFPPFNHMEARKGKLIRSPMDRGADVAELRDLYAVAQYAAQCATQAVTTVNDEMHAFYQAQLQLHANNVAVAIVAAINEYDRRRREAAWYRKLWRWVARPITRRRAPAPAHLSVVKPSVPPGTAP